MSESCCNSCPEVQQTNVPGPEGADGTPGTDGTDGQNAYTQTTADFDTPLANANVTVSLINSDWMSIGQIVVVDGPANFEVISKPTSTSAILKYLDYPGDVGEGQTISTGVNVSPAGVEGPSNSLIPAISDYTVGGAGALTSSVAQILGASVTLTETRSYLLLASFRFDFAVATFPASESLTAKLRRTNNTAGDIANAIAVSETGIQTAVSQTMGCAPIPPVVYSANAGDVIELWAGLSDTPYSGAVNAVEASIVAIPLF